MIAVWTLIVLTCTGPGTTGDCTTQRQATHGTRWECRQAAIGREIIDERVRAWCQRGMV